MHRFQLALAVACGSATQGQAVGSVQCPHDAYQSSAVVVDCAGKTGQATVRLKKDQTRSIAIFPAGTDKVSMELKSDVDFDLRLMDGSTGKCIVGFSCMHSAKCQNASDYCISYRGMQVYYSGDDLSTPVTERIKIAGKLTRPMVFSTYASGDGESTIDFSYGTIASCPSPLPGCTPCEDYSCGPGDPDTTGAVPKCNGTSHVECVVPATTGLSTTVQRSTTIAATEASTTTTTTMPGIVHQWSDSRTTTSPEPNTTTTTGAVFVPCNTMAPLPPTTTPFVPCDTFAPLPPTPVTLAPLPPTPVTLAPLPPTPGPDPVNPCSVVSPSVIAVASSLQNPGVGSAIIADPPEEPYYEPTGTLRPCAISSAAQLTKDGRSDVWKQLATNISAGTQEVTGAIRQTIVNGLEKAQTNIKKAGHKIDHTFDHIMHSMEQGLDRDATTLKNLREGGQTQILGKSQRTSNNPAARSQSEVPLAFGSRFASLFQSWCSPGSLCMMGLIGALLALASMSSTRSCVVLRRTIAGYAQVSLPGARRAAASRSSRELNDFVTPCEDGEVLLTGRGDIGVEGLSHVQLLEADVVVE